MFFLINSLILFGLGFITNVIYIIFFTYIFKIVHALLDVFVGIEMTGQSVEFEQKFNYRRPMYVVMDYLWKIEEHREVFK